MPLLVMYMTLNLESSKGLLPIATLGVSSDVTSLLTLVLCDSASTHSWVSPSPVNRLGLLGEPVSLSIGSFNSTTVVETQRVKFTVFSGRIIVISYSLGVHMLKTIFGLVPK